MHAISRAEIRKSKRPVAVTRLKTVTTIQGRNREDFFAAPERSFFRYRRSAQHFGGISDLSGRDIVIRLFTFMRLFFAIFFFVLAQA